MMDAKILFRILRAECKKNFDCDTCPFCECICSADGSRKFIDSFFEASMDETIRVAESIAHTKTYADDFFEKFPNAAKRDDGTPGVCRDQVYGTESANCLDGCRSCWNKPMKEEETT